MEEESLDNHVGASRHAEMPISGSKAFAVEPAPSATESGDRSSRAPYTGKDEDYFKDPFRPPPPADGPLNTSFLVPSRHKEPSKRELAAARKACGKLGKEIAKLNGQQSELSAVRAILENSSPDSFKPRSCYYLAMGFAQSVLSVFNIAIGAVRGTEINLVIGGLWGLIAALNLAQHFTKGRGRLVSPAHERAARIMARVRRSDHCGEAMRRELARLDEEAAGLYEHLAVHEKELEQYQKILKEVNAGGPGQESDRSNR